MDNYEKIYDYEVDKRVTGFLLAFIAMMILFEPLYSIIFMFQAGRAFSSAPLSGNIFKICEVFYLCFIFFTCFSFYKIPGHAVNVAKSFLIFRFIFLTMSILINLDYALHDKNAIGPRLYQFSSVQDLIVKLFIIPESYVLIFSMGWLIFLIKSKTIQKAFGRL